MRRKNLPRYHSFCVNDTTQMLTRKGCCTVHLNAAGRGGLHSRRGVSPCDFTVPAPKGYAMSSATQFHQPCALCKVSTFCFFIIAFQPILSYFIEVVKGFGGESKWKTKFYTSPTAIPSFVRSVKARMPFLCRRAKKGQKKISQDVPSWISLGIAVLQL